MTPKLHLRIKRMRERGMTLQAIADGLNREGVPTLRGGAMWRPSSVEAAAGYKRRSRAGSQSSYPKSSVITQVERSMTNRSRE